jgi:hypothetical protein
VQVLGRGGAGVPKPTPTPTASSGGGSSNGLAVAALIVGALGLITGAAALTRARRLSSRSGAAA